MTSPRRTKKSVSQCTEQNLDWDSPSAATGTVRRRSCPDHRHTTHSQTAIFEVETPSDSGSATSRSIDGDGLIDIEQRISFIINENRSSNSNSESSEVDIIIDSYLNNPLNEDFFEIHHGSLHDRSNTFIIPEEAAANEKCNAASLNEASSDKKNKERKLKAPAPIKKLNKPFDIVKHSSKVKETKKIEYKASVLPVYRSTVQGTDIDLSNSKKRVASKLRMPFSPTRAMDKPKMNFFQNKTNFPEGKPSPLLSSPVRRTISNEYVRLKFTNDTVLRRTIDGKPVPKITPKIQSIIPESPVDSEDPFLNLSPNKKYTVTVNNKVRCDKDNYVIFDPATGFGDAGRSRIPLKSPSADSSRIPLRSLEGETAGPARKSANVSDTDSGILSPNSPVETSERGYYANAAAFSDSTQKCATKLDITIVDPGLAQKAAEQIQYMERRFYTSQPQRTTIPASFKVPEPGEFYTKATPFVQRTLLFVADETTGPPRALDNNQENKTDGQSVNVQDIASTSRPVEEQEKSPKKSFFFSPSKSCKHGRSFFRTSPKKGREEKKEEAGGGKAGGGLISYAPGWSLKGEHLMKWQESGKTTIEIYTDWANHYLERARSRRRVAAGGGGLARDCADGLLLCDVLEGVTGQRVPRAHRKPRTKQQMLENVQGCLEFLHAQHVQGLDQVTAADIRDAKLKAVLALFFALSRHKQATKQRTAPSSGNAANGVKNSAEDASLSSVQRITGGSSCDEVLTTRDSATEMTTLTASRQSGGLGTCIPVPGSAAAVRRAPPDRRPLPATPTHGRGVSACSSRSSSPPAALSFIPRPPSSTGSRPNSSLLAPGSKLPGAPSPAPHNGTAAVHTGAGKHSMLDKLKLFNKDKQPVGDKQHKAASNKRTSSSSGFSSAKSERSDSSLSLNEGSHAKASLLGPKARHNDTLAKDKSGKNVKSKLITSKAPKDSTTNLSKASGKTVSSEKSRNSPKLPARDKESKLAAPKSISNTKLNQIDDHSRNQKTKPESKMVKLSGSQLKLSEQRTETTDTGNQDLTLQKAPASQPQLPPSGQFGAPTHTGIPKPTAAVKGTFKVSKDDRHIISKSTNSQLSPIQSNSSLNSTNNVSALPFSREQSNLSKETSVSQKQTLAVSPMPAHTPAMSDSQDSRHSGSTGVGHHSTSSDGSSVIYRPSSESGSDCKPSKRLDMSAAYIDDVINEAEISEKEAAQHRVQNHLQAKSGFDPNRTLTELSGSRSSTPSHWREGSLGEDEHALMSVVPMRPLLRGYSSHLTLPLRAPPYPRHTSTVRAGYAPRSNPDYMDAELAAGYMSDGDCLRLRAGPPPPPPDADGYLSEGGASLYARRHLAPAPPLLDDRGNACAGGGGGRRGMEGGVVYRVVGRSRSKQDSAQQTERHRKYPEPAPTQPPSPGGGGGGGRRERREAHRRDKPSAAHQLAVSAQHQYAANLPSQHSSRSGGSQAASPSAGGGRVASAASNGSACGAPGGGAGGAPGGGKAKVPQSFGYVKRQNGAPHPPHPPHTPPPPQHNGGPHHVTPQPLNGRTAQVSAVPRTKVKVSGGTQTCTQDLQNLQIHKNGIGPKSFSLGGCAAAQLSASVRERLLGSQSLPKPGSHDFAALFHHHRGSGSPRALKVSDGSLSDTQAYAEPAKHEYTPYAPSHRHSNTYSGRAECEPEGGGGGGHRTPLAHNKQPPPRLNRSNSISYLRDRTFPRSTKSEKLYGVCAREPDYSPYYCLPVHYQHHGGGYGAGASEPPSPGAVCGARGALSPTPPHHTPRHSHYYPKKNDDAHGSSASLVSTASSLAAGAGVEERQQHEVRKLRRELADAKEKVHTLTTQLTTNAHVVSAFEQSLSNMTQRLHQLTATAERKDSELTELRQTIELLRKQSIQAGLTTAHMHSMGIPADLATQEGGGGGRAGGGGGGSMSRHLSTDSVASATSLSSGSSNLDKKLKKKGWLRSSFTKAFSRNAKISKTAKHASFGQLAGEGAGGAGGAHLYDDPSTIREGEREDSLEPEPPAPAPAPPAPAPSEPELNGKEKEESHLVDELKRQLREKELVLTDIRLEALSSAHQLESLKDTVTKMRNEMLNLKQNNERLQRLVTSRSLAGSQSSLAAGEARRYSLAEAGSEPLYEAALPEPLYGNTAAVEGALFAAAARDHAALPPPTARELAIGETYHDLGCGEAGAEGEGEGKRIAIAVFLGPPDSFPRYLEEVQDTLTEAECGLPAPELPAPGAADLPVAYTRVSGKTTWQALDYTVRKALKEYLARVDPGAGLGLSTDCVVSYHLGEATRGPERPLPPLLPCGYIVGTVSTLYVCLDAVGSLAFDSLIPRSIVHRYVSLVSEHRRVILCGPSGTGKSYLAAKLAEYHVQRTTRRGNPAGAVATFNVERKSSSELRAFLSNIAEQSAAAAAGEEAPLPSVLVLDNLAHAAALGDVFAGLPAAHGARMPLIIGTMSQATCDTTNLQLQHDFRWLLTANHLEPVKGFLARYLRRKLVARELGGRREPALRAVVEWLPAVWAALNAFLEAVAASDVTVGPRLFLACPMDARASQAWFADVWNYSVVPYCSEAAREGARLYGRRAARDPTHHVRATWPWPARTHDTALRPILPEGAPDPPPEPDAQDPLLGMLLRLQEAADYGAADRDSDNASLDSNLTHDSSLGADP